MAESRGNLLLLDTASLYFRAFFGIPESIQAPDGTPINAVRGLLEGIASLVTRHRPARIVACWDDDWRPAFRVAAIPSYKAHRARPGTDEEEVPATLATQIPIIVEALAAFGIARVGAPGYEADDVIGTLATREVNRLRGTGQSADVEIATGDRDLFQLVDDADGVRVLYTVRGLRRLDVVDQAWLRNRYGVATGAAYADLAVLRGDPSDGLPGIPGVGEKTAAALLERFGTLAGVLAARDAGDPRLSPGLRRKLLDAAAYLEVAPSVVRVARDAPIPEIDDALPRSPAHPDDVVALAQRWGLVGPAMRLTNALTAAAQPGTAT